jgi:uncharacterized radical SAM superfamily Fe-S cluster-containing enzyme
MRVRDKAFVGLADLGWKTFQAINTRLPESGTYRPSWAPTTLQKSRERSFPPLDYPRETDSLCPDCVKEMRKAVIAGERDIQELTGEHDGIIKAQLLEEGGRIVIRKTCPIHGTYEDLLSIDAEFTRRVGRRYYGRDYRISDDANVHCHGPSSIRYGRGGILTIDLTNRCNMRCNPCFTNANQVGYVHELTRDDLQRILEASISFKPRRQLSVQFSGGEPTLSPIFLDALRMAKEIGYYSTQAATNGVRFALEPELAPAAKEAGLDLVYFQLDGVTNEANQHRHIPNLFDVKLLAIENLFKAGVEVIPVTTVVNTLNNDQVGPLVQLVIDNCDRMSGISFQPVAFTGRDEDISDERRHRERYTISHLAHDLARWSGGKIDLVRDWFPVGALGGFSVLVDHLRDPEAKFGCVNCSAHPDCGASFYLLANKKTGEWRPVTQFFDMEQFAKDIQIMTNTARSPKLLKAQVVASLLRNFKPDQLPRGFEITQMIHLINRKLGGALTNGKRPPEKEWKFLWVGGMWFQDLWISDLTRTEMCGIPYATQEGEISFCAYNTGVGWRQIVENRHMSATLRDWFKTQGRHKIYGGNREIPLPQETDHVTTKVPGNGDAKNCITRTRGKNYGNLWKRQTTGRADRSPRGSHPHVDRDRSGQPGGSRAKLD